MELIVLLLGCSLVLAFAAVHKSISRRRFRKAVAVYETARQQRIDAGAPPSSIPTVEEFLTKRGEYHLLDIDHLGSIRNENEDDFDHAYEDDSYERFVASMWSKPAIDLGGIVVKRGHGLSDVICELRSLVEGDAGRLYLNLLENGVPKTYAADSRHRWYMDGYEIDHSAFAGIHRGADPRIVLRPERYPTSFDEAISEQFDRFQTTDAKFAIAYQTVKGLSFRVISRVIRSEETFSARCHFRWGERRTFRKAGLLEVFDMQSWELVEVQTFLKKRGVSR